MKFTNKFKGFEVRLGARREEERNLSVHISTRGFRDDKATQHTTRNLDPGLIIEMKGFQSNDVYNLIYN